MDFAKIHALQADVIFKALYYTARAEGIEIPKELTETYKVLAEWNPKETGSYQTVEVMEYLNDFIKNNGEYSEYFIEEVEDDE
jgi:hypothetical protein